MKLTSATRMVTGQFGIELDALIVKVPPCSLKNSQSLKRERERLFCSVKTRVETVSRMSQILPMVFTIHTEKKIL